MRAMRGTPLLVCASLAIGVLNALAIAQPSRIPRANRVIALLEHEQPVFGVYWPANASGRGRAGAPPPSEVAPKAPAVLAREALAYHEADFYFSGALEGGFERGYGPVSDFVKATVDAVAATRTRFLSASTPLIVKVPKISTDRTKAAADIGRALNLGVSGLMFVEVESADEVRAGLAAMRFKSKGGTRSDDTGDAPAYWGMSDDRYKQKADLWPLNRDGELINWTIVESKEGLAHVREIAAVDGIGVLWPGAGTLRGVFSTTNAAGERVVDTAAWENAIQQVLAACQEFHVPCGFPATANDIEMRLKQGFSVFVMNWGEAGFKTIEIGRKAASR
jgi:2-keto-3-deoxy-L-rhamnonate aldolase RhmA